jgi:hypothetical protein
MKRLHRTCALLLCVLLLPAIVSAQAFRDGPIYRWNGSGFDHIPGVGSRIAVAPDGSAWLINAAGEIYHSRGDQFERMPGYATDVAVGREGSVWIIGNDAGIYRWRNNSWERVEGSGKAIAVDRFGEPWVVNSDGDIYHRITGHFQKQQGTASDIGVDNDVWIVAPDSAVRQLTRNGRWSSPQGSAVRISVSSQGPWVVNDVNQIYRWDSGGFRQVPGAALDVGVNSRGDAWVIGVPDSIPTAGSDPQDHRARRRR